jgi:hypothetical protein
VKKGRQIDSKGADRSTNCHTDGQLESRGTDRVKGREKRKGKSRREKEDISAIHGLRIIKEPLHWTLKFIFT